MSSNVSRGGQTASQKTTKGTGPQLAIDGREGSADHIRKVLDEDGKELDGVVFAGNVGHLSLRPPRPIYNQNHEQVGLDKGVFMDFQGVGVTRVYNPDIATDAQEIKDIRELIEQHPRHPDVDQFDIRELQPDDPTPPFEKWDKYGADAIKGWLEPSLGANHDDNVRLVKRCAEYEVSAKNRADVLAMLDVLLVSEASVSDAFSTEIKLS